MTDQQRYDQVGYGSDGHFQTPNLDRLAAEGVVFDTAYSTSTTCVPARVGLLTGLLHHRVPKQGKRRFSLQEGFWTLAHALRNAGYETALFGKMHFSPVRAQHGFETQRLVEHLTDAQLADGPDDDDYHRWLVSQGVDDWRALFSPTKKTPSTFPYDASLHPTAWIEQETLSFLRTRSRDRPLFLIVSFPHPHAPYNPPASYLDLYDPADARLPNDTAEANATLPTKFRMAFERFGTRVPPRVDPANPKPLRGFLTKVRALVKQIDDSVGAIARELDLDRTVVFFTSDHGDWAGHRGAMRKIPWLPFDDLARVPFFVSGAGVASGRRVASLVQSSDFVPTCLDYAGVEGPVSELDSQSLRPLLSEPPATGDDERAVVCATTMGWPMIRRGNVKYMRHGGSRVEVLFDLDEDPGETTTRHEDSAYCEVRDELSAALDAVLARGVPELQVAR
jgi:choline-sulfatase